MIRPQAIPALDLSIAERMGLERRIVGDPITLQVRTSDRDWWSFSPTSDANDRDTAIAYANRRGYEVRVTHYVDDLCLVELFYGSKLVFCSRPTTPGEAVCRAVEAMEGK